jgi:uncharacterized protein YgiM (DUF1202 family)
MSQKKGLLPKLEILIIGVFAVAFLLWAASKCSSTRQAYQLKSEQEQAEQAQEDSLSQAAANEMVFDTTMRIKPVDPYLTKERVTVLYASVDGVNVRSGPGLNYQIIDRLKLFDQVLFLDEVSDFTQEITLGEITTNEPWIKVRTAKKQEGWVYGATLSYYKKKLEGVDTE